MTNQLPVAGPRRVFACLWALLRGRRLAMAGVLAIFLLEAATALVVPLVIGRVVDQILDESAVTVDFWWLVAALVGAAVGAGLFTWAGFVLLARIMESAIADLREDFVDSALSLPRSRVEEAGTGDVVTRASDDIAKISQSLPDVVPQVFVSVFTIVLIAATAASLDWRFFLAFLVIIPLYALTIRWYAHNAPQVYRTQREVESVRGQHILGTFDNLDTVVALGTNEKQMDRIADSSWQKVRWSMRARIMQNRLWGRINAAQGIGLLTVLTVGVWLATENIATAGAVTTAALLFQRIIAPLQALLMVMDQLQAALAALGRLVGVIDMREQESEPPASESFISLDGVTFTYPSAAAPALRDISVSLNPSETVAVVGSSGSGKSTMASLIAGVYAPTSGTLHRGVPAESVATLTQETHIFIGTVRENLALAAPTATDDDIKAALTAVGADELVASLPDGLNTMLGHGNHTLAPAQAQHLALARVLLRDPEVVILDEATADTDTADAGLLDRASNVVTTDRCALVIAHRLSQTATADRIIVLEDGVIAEQGTHDELVSAAGVYGRLWAAWSAS